ncbi:aldose 1-epimerase [Luteibacter sp. UNC138MFCol5.1]|uniref:aldose 1-epimerase n=1 Tax=Luteibacter sp. UNC138MFCol5.1 TaxID=1502774 RepID=UPI0008D641CE|nr:hypothetical protein [Luteibacter sp. UNC138MFCol5.1]SEP02334.1 aldose 1-epimerase [Luteibacter sp. UNC138MFCol5.1]
MSRFTVTRASLGAQEIVVLRDLDDDRAVRIARSGATVLSITTETGGKTHDIVDGFRNEKELLGHKGSRFAVMTPFANRVDDARFTFEGSSYDLQPGAVGADRAARHGFLRGVIFDVTAEQGGESAATVTFSTNIAPDEHPGYPFSLAFSITYTLDANGLTLEATTTNTGHRDAPTFFGWHPYFRISSHPIKTWELHIPADTVIAAREDFIPLPGTAAWMSLDRADRKLDFRKPRLIGDTELNNTYADLQFDPDGRARTRLRDPATGQCIALWQERGVMLAFTSDTAERDARKSVALEPMECMPNAFNREDCAPLITLKPREKRSFVCGVEFDA